jgi:hypothetical protein
MCTKTTHTTAAAAAAAAAGAELRFCKCTGGSRGVVCQRRLQAGANGGVCVVAVGCYAAVASCRAVPCRVSQMLGSSVAWCVFVCSLKRVPHTVPHCVCVCFVRVLSMCAGNNTRTLRVRVFCACAVNVCGEYSSGPPTERAPRSSVGGGGCGARAHGSQWQTAYDSPSQRQLVCTHTAMQGEPMPTFAWHFLPGLPVVRVSARVFAGGVS